MGPAQADVISGNVAMFLPNITGQVIELHRTGRIRILAAGSPERHAALPDIPTAVESGVAGMIVQNFFGIFGPAGLPKTVVDRLNEATQVALADRGFQRDIERRRIRPDVGIWPGASQGVHQGRVRALASRREGGRHQD
jgi:tripartite-type tricarboxylate transporter receptor subunit TctC